MTAGSLFNGFALLLVLLIIAGVAGGIGSVELLIWLALVTAWIAWWMVSRRRSDPAP